MGCLPNVLKTYPKQHALINKFLLNLMRRESSPTLKSQAIEVMSSEIREIGGEAKTECIRELTKFLSATHYHRIHFQIFLGYQSGGRQGGRQQRSVQAPDLRNLSARGTSAGVWVVDTHPPVAARAEAEAGPRPHDCRVQSGQQSGGKGKAALPGEGETHQQLRVGPDRELPHLQRG